MLLYNSSQRQCESTGILILVLLTSNIQSFYDKQFIVKLHGSQYFERKNVYENDTSITRINEKNPVYINGSHTRGIHPYGATHMFHHSQWGAISINYPKYLFNIIYDDDIHCGENNVQDTIRVMAMRRLSNIINAAYLQILFKNKGYF